VVKFVDSHQQPWERVEDVLEHLLFGVETTGLHVLRPAAMSAQEQCENRSDDVQASEHIGRHRCANAMLRIILSSPTVRRCAGLPTVPLEASIFSRVAFCAGEGFLP
jgi:hypothetical protein